MRLRGECFRAHDPRWSFEPLSGEGARRSGGRFNPAGVPALYLSLSLEGCILEAKQGLKARMVPLTVVSYDVDIEGVAQLTDAGERDRLAAPLGELACGWIVDRAAGRVPPSWAIAERLRRDYAGILVPSFAPGATAAHTNLVLWLWNDEPDRTVVAFDPDQRLPRDQTSWR